MVLSPFSYPPPSFYNVSLPFPSLYIHLLPPLLPPLLVRISLPISLPLLPFPAWLLLPCSQTASISSWRCCRNLWSYGQQQKWFWSTLGWKRKPTPTLTKKWTFLTHYNMASLCHNLPLQKRQERNCISDSSLKSWLLSCVWDVQM